MGEFLEQRRDRSLRSDEQTWKVWNLPKSKGGCYAVYVDNNDKVWVTDFVANAIHRFDPATETFELSSDKRGASVRQLLGRPGRSGAPNPAWTGWSYRRLI